ncbi:hypothetical protein IQ241_10195 [Romeria aff. gracilis LEGE 07310]|uniref:Uncharacterized protein n=1 Tax=Vasconcelosia minhoensis LEGE 07310 TaxID=915328 RepID=A0A8J7DBF2_9CYAN|nr:hypothetical protein [Romeria aff. gracilis LEGE 07310]
MNNPTALIIEIADQPPAINEDAMNALTPLHNPAKRRIGSRAFALVEDSLVMRLKGLAQLAFGQGIDHFNGLPS